MSRALPLCMLLLAACSGPGGVSGNSSPVFLDVVPPAGSVFESGAAVRFTVFVADPQDPPELLAVSFESDVDGALGEVGVLPDGSASMSTATLSPGVHSVLIKATDSGGLSNATRTELRINLAPGTAPILLLPPAPRTTDMLEVVLTASVGDPDDDSVSLHYAWFRDGLEQRELGGRTSVPWSATHRGEEWRVQVVANDGRVDGEASEAAVTILNSLPVVGSVSLDPPVPTGSGPVRCVTTDVSDADGDAIVVRIEWEVEGVAAGSDALLPVRAFERGDQIRCTAWATDPLGTGLPAQSAVVEVVNGAPSLTGVVVEPENPVTGDRLTCTPMGFSDPEGDADLTELRWSVDGLEVGLGPTLQRGFVGGQIVTCRATPSDGRSRGNPVEEAVLVANSPPRLSSVGLGPSVAYEGDTLSCNVGGVSDVDGLSTVELVYTWTVNGAAVPGSGPTLGSAHFDRDDVVRCAVVASDGVDQSPMVVSPSITIANHVPVVFGVGISPAPPMAGGPLLCTWTAADGDGDPDLAAVRWTINGVPAGSTPELTGGFAGGDSVACTVTPFDGSATGTAVSVARPVVNAPPAVQWAEVAPLEPVALDDIRCSSGGASDADGDAVTVRHAWYVNGVAAGEGDLLPVEVVRDDEVTCTAVPWDGVTDGVPATAVVVVANTAPVVTDIDIDPNPPHVGDVLVCGWRVSDPDGDPDRSEVRWTVDGAPSSEGDVLGVPLVAGMVVACEVTPSDGLDVGHPVGVEVVVQP